eukprot:m.213601 g.213601  ORF g.213601 m.213601 type:complete len:213 (+) comp17178_c0_seq6:911-1549(+)
MSGGSSMACSQLRVPNLASHSGMVCRLTSAALFQLCQSGALALQSLDLRGTTPSSIVVKILMLHGKHLTTLRVDIFDGLAAVLALCPKLSKLYLVNSSESKSNVWPKIFQHLPEQLKELHCDSPFSFDKAYLSSLVLHYALTRVTIRVPEVAGLEQTVRRMVEAAKPSLKRAVRVRRSFDLPPKIVAFAPAKLPRNVWKLSTLSSMMNPRED